MEMRFKVDFEQVAKKFNDHFNTNFTTKQVEELWRNGRTHFESSMRAAFFNSMHQSMWTISKLNPEKLATFALQHCNQKERAEILFELKGVTGNA